MAGHNPLPSDDHKPERTAGLWSVNIAIPVIAEDLNASLIMVSWVISGYLLVFAAAILPTLPAILFSILARDRKVGRAESAELEEEDAAMAGF